MSIHPLFRRIVLAAAVFMLVLTMPACGQDHAANKTAPTGTRTVQPITPGNQSSIVLPQAKTYFDGGLAFGLPEGWVVDESMAGSQLIAFFNSQAGMDEIGGIDNAVGSLLNGLEQSFQNPSGTAESTPGQRTFVLPDGIALGIMMLIPRDEASSARTPPAFLDEIFMQGGFPFVAETSAALVLDGQPAAQTIIHNRDTQNADHAVTGLVGLVEYSRVYALCITFSYSVDFDTYRPTFEAIQQSIQVR